MSDLSVGTLTTSGSSTYISGTTSGLDTDALVENAVAANNDKADKIDIRVEENQSKIDGYEEYYSLSSALQDSLSSLKNITSRANTESSVFSQRTGTVSSDGTDASGLVSVSIDSDAPAGEYDITVLQKAQEMVVQSSVVPSKTDPLNITGKYAIGLAGLDPEEITVTEDMSLQDIADAINQGTESSGVSASIFKVSESEYQLVLSGTETNLDIEVSTTSGTALEDLGLTDGSDTFLDSQVTQEAQGSIILFQSTQISRNDNTYDDLIDGVSFDVKGADPDTTVTLTVENDVSSVKDAIESFVDAYNALRDFFITNQTVNSDGSIPDDAVLFSDPMLEGMSFSLSRLLSESRSSSSEVQTIRDLGIVFDDDNKLVIDDETALDDALLNNFSAVESFFSSTITTSNSSLGVISDTSTARSLDFDIKITMDGSGGIASATVNGSSEAFDIQGTRLIGKTGTQYEGLTLAYVGEGDATVSVSIKAGLADLIYNSVETYTSASGGLIQKEISNLQGINDDLNTQAEEIRTRGEEIREREIQRYADMEMKLALAENLMAQIKAILGTDSSNG